MMSALYVIRHGRTDWNTIKRIQGRTDTPLNEEGISMAGEAAKRYSSVHFDICFCSPLMRAKQTAQILLAGRDIPVEYDDRLKELSFGEYEGLEYPLLPEDHPVRDAFRDPDNFHPAPGGETIRELLKRTGDFLEDKVYPLIDEGKDVLIVGHGAMNSALTVNVKKLPVEKFWEEGIENCVLKQLI